MNGESMVAELYRIADELEAEGEADAAATIRQTAQRLEGVARQLSSLADEFDALDEEDE